MSQRFARRKQAVVRWSKDAYGLLSETVDEYSKDRGDMVAAALAFYTLLSMAPLIIIAVAVAGAVLGRGTAQGEALRLVHDTMGQNAASAVGDWVQQASDSGGLASIVGGALLVYTASRLGTQLRIGLNQVWNVDEFLAEGFKSAVRDYVQRRLFAFVLVLASGPILLVVFASRALLTGFYDVLFVGTPLAGAAVELSQLGLSFVLVALVSAVVFKIVPDTRVGWRAVLYGGLLTSLLFNVGNFFVGLYLGRATVAQTYGAAGSAIVVLLWLYFSAQMFLFGAEFTQVYARHYGRGLKPQEQRELDQVARRGTAPA